MKRLIITAALLMAFALSSSGCTNTQPAYYGAYPSDFGFGPNHGYEPYATAPHDPVGSYYQNFAPATPFYYEPPESHRDCDARPCIAYHRNAETLPLEPKIIALPSEKQSSNSPPSTISRASHPTPVRTRHPHDVDREP